MASDSEAPTATAPPSRVAARLNRAANRKSASSSRRNSMSSLHSSMSNRSGYSRSQSTHIAQHLRRTSIIEDRKAKLAERNAHAELVRMRAQQAKAASRSIKLSNERAQAAQQSRERHLAQVAASGADEVKRAKKIAEDAREKKAAETLKLREDMEEKHADAEKRRLLLQTQQIQRRARTHSLPAVEEKKVSVKPWKPKSQDLAAQVIQHAWRNSRRRRAMAEFSSLNLDMESVQAQTFEAVTARVAETKVLSATTNMLKLCNLMNMEEAAAEREANVRIFLAAYLVLGHPKEVLSKSGDLEEHLIGKSKMLLMQFQRLLSKPATGKTFSPTTELMISLTEAYGDFQTAFKSWKTRDASFIIEGAIAQFVELDTIWQTVKHDTRGGVAEDYREGIRNSQATILVRLKRILGHDRALKMVNDAVRARRKSKAKRKPLRDVKPRTASTGTGEASKSIDTSTGATAASPRASASAPHDRSAQLEALNSAISPMPDNRVVIHELAINRDFQIDINMTSEGRDVINRAVFNAMRADVANGEGDKWILSMADTIRERLLRLVVPGKSFHSMISEFLDPTIIESQLRVGNFSYEKFFAFMNTLLPKLCAPVRDTTVKALATDTSSDFIERLAATIHVIDLLALDHANYLLSLNAAELIRRAPDYEQHCFEKALGSSSLAQTTQWWRQSRARATADLARRSPEGSTPKPPTASRIYTTGLVDLFLTLAPLQTSEIPETLALDAKRIATARADVLRIVTISSILLTAKNLLKRDVRTQWKAQAQRMWDLPASSAYTDPAPYLTILDATSGAAMPPAVRASLTGTVDTVLANARAAPALSHAVMKVLLRKIREHATARLAASSSEEQVRNASTATEVLGAGGLVEFVPRVTALVEEMGRVRQVDWDGHGAWIDRVAAGVERESRV